MELGNLPPVAGRFRNDVKLIADPRAVSPAP